MIVERRISDVKLNSFQDKNEKKNGLLTRFSRVYCVHVIHTLYFYYIFIST
jgi:hypothetical protein